jgi:class 3 adenylate cyclase
MFSDVRDFTSIAESLSQRDLLFILTKYLNTITGIVEACGGVVTEILGDGVLAFWNTPDDVVDHATKGCQAALAQQEALLSLNDLFQSKGLPQLQIRIGLHTGTVLSGNLGSETKMKFGCMGDPVNLASRLEGLCKNYGTGVMCSGATFDSLVSAAGLVCQYIDLVQVKGRSQATRVYSVLGFSSFAHASRASCGTQFVVTPNQMKQIEEYEETLKAWQNANFAEAWKRTECLFKSWPDDMAVAQLRDRVQKKLTEENSTASSMTPEERAAWTGALIMHEK